MATALTTLVTNTGYLLGITPSASTVPTSTEITQWLKDAQRDMLNRLPSRFLYKRVVRETTGTSLASPYNVADYSSIDIAKIRSGVLYDSSGTSYHQCKVIQNIEEFNNLILTDSSNPMYQYIISWDPNDGKVYCFPTGATGDKLYLTYLLDIDGTDTNYELEEQTERLACFYAAAMHSIGQVGDYLGVGQKFLTMYELGIKSLGGR